MGLTYPIIIGSRDSILGPGDAMWYSYDALVLAMVICAKIAHVTSFQRYCSQAAVPSSVCKFSEV